MKTILLVGCGGLGIRHAESILNNQNYFLHIIDNSKKRVVDINKKFKSKKNNLKVSSSLSSLYKFYDLIIIATTSYKRENILKDIIKKTYSKNYILEKIVFTSINPYNYFINYFKNKKINCWVNCPNRFYDSYNFLKKKLNKNYKLSMIVSGNNWGLASNFVHYTDLFSFLTNKISLEIESFNLDNKVIKSKRKNFVEFNGSIILKTMNGEYLNIFHNKNTFDTIVTIEIINGKLSFLYREGDKYATLHFNNEILKIPFKIPFQSSITENYLKNIFSNKKLNLPSLEEHYKINVNIIRELIKFYNLSNSGKKEYVPIS